MILITARVVVNLNIDVNASEDNKMIKLKNCPFCKSNEIKDYYVYIQCNNCLMTGPQENGGRNDAHSDYLDRERAIKNWNELPRRNS